MAAAEVQALLRFLTQDAKIPLVEAMPKIGAMRKHGLNTTDAIIGADTKIIQEIFTDEKIAKQVVNAAKRVSNPKKRSASNSSLRSTKRSRNDEHTTPRDLEADLALPTTPASVEELETISIETNRAPLVLAFALVVLEFTMPEQPLSSRLSLAQTVVSLNSQTKAKSIGLVSGNTAEDEGWAKGQPKVTVLGREIAVMRRQIQAISSEEDSQETIKEEAMPAHDAFWGLDIEALRKSNGPLVAGKLAGSQGPPIHTPQAARSYLLKSIAMHSSKSQFEGSAGNAKRKPTGAEIAISKEKAVAAVLKAIQLVCESWTATLSTADLDKKAWSWYLSVRPDVAQGQSGWGQRGIVKLADILRLRRRS